MHSFRPYIVAGFAVLAIGTLATGFSHPALANDPQKQETNAPPPKKVPAGVQPGHGPVGAAPAHGPGGAAPAHGPVGAPGHAPMAAGHPEAHGRAFAEHDHPVAERERYEFHHHDWHHFDPYERERWRAGRWINTCFDGLCGWWWLAGGVWHYYPQPIYPYPLIVSEQVYVEPMVVVPSAPVMVVPAPAPVPVPVPVPAPAPMVIAPSAAAQTRYYCDNPPGFYPAVQTCAGQFRPVAP